MTLAKLPLNPGLQGFRALIIIVIQKRKIVQPSFRGPRMNKKINQN
jgi:hypothetical protein